MKFEIDVLHDEFYEHVSGIKTFFLGKRDQYNVGDIIVLRERRNGLYTGRICECHVTNVYSGEKCAPGVSILSYFITFPANEIMVPLTAFMDLQSLLSEARRECESLKEKYS